MTNICDDPIAELDLHTFIVPRQSWQLEVAGETFDKLADAEAASQRNGAPIYCRPKQAKKAAASW